MHFQIRLAAASGARLPGLPGFWATVSVDALAVLLAGMVAGFASGVLCALRVLRRLLTATFAFAFAAGLFILERETFFLVTFVLLGVQKIFQQRKRLSLLRRRLRLDFRDILTLDLKFTTTRRLMRLVLLNLLMLLLTLIFI